MFVEITNNNIELLQVFISSMGNSAESFRYYNKRTIDVVENHLVTSLVVLNGIPVGYGHLDCEGNKVWLGIAVSEGFRGKGIGKLVMEYLILKAEEINLSNIYLSVDKDNSQAIKLYEKFGFLEINKENDVLYFVRNLDI